MKIVDFSCKHHVLIEGVDGIRIPMDVPYFEAALIANDTWQILSDGDYSYLFAGDNEAVVIDSGYGCGNIREYCQTLTCKPIRTILNTHCHFDHTANNYCFDKAMMSEETRKNLAEPSPSFSGIVFPRDYPIEILRDGDRIDLGGRTLEVIATRLHTPGSLSFLDRRERLLVSGDEILPDGMRIMRISLDEALADVKRLASFADAYDRLCAGPGVIDKKLVYLYQEALEQLILHPELATPLMEEKREERLENVTVYKRRLPRPCDLVHPSVKSQAGEMKVYDRNGCRIISFM